MRQWIFLDVGSTLVDETEALEHRLREITAGTGVTREMFEEKRIELAQTGADGNQAAIKFFNLVKTPWHSEDETPFEDSAETLDYLKKRGYKLGVIANQPLGTEDRLSKWGLLHYFDVIAASAEVGATKPDKKIFETAFELAHCSPSDAVMVGDRLDNDMIPAKALGMQTVWIRKGISAKQNIALGNGVADFAIDNISDLKKIF